MQTKPNQPPNAHTKRKPKQIPESFQVVIECRTEHEQRELYDRLTAEGQTCNLRIL